jgi:hypothetical protein
MAVLERQPVSIRRTNIRKKVNDRQLDTRDCHGLNSVFNLTKKILCLDDFVV